MGDQLAPPKNVLGPATPEPDKLSRSSACDYYSKMVNPEKDAPERFQAEVSKLKDEFNALDKEVRAGGKSIVRGIGQMIPALAQMEPFLSRKGEHHEPHYVKMLIAAGLPSWEDYKKQVAAEFEMSVRTVQRKLEEHRGYPREHQPRRLADGNGSGSAGEARPDPAQATAVATAAKNLAGAKKEQAVTAADSSALTSENNSTPDNGVVINPTESDSAGVRLAEEGFLIAALPVAEPEKVAAAPDKPDPSVSKLNAEPDWKQILVQLMDVLEKYGEKLPLAVLSQKRAVEKLLEGKDLPFAAREVPQHPAKRYQKPKKVDSRAISAAP